MRVVLSVALFVFLGLLYGSTDFRVSKNRKILFSAICAFVLLFFATKRGLTFTSDIQSYLNNYKTIQGLSYHSLFDLLLSGNGKDMVYSIVAKTASSLGISFFVYINIIFLFYIVIISWFICKYSSNIYMSFVLLVVFGHYYFALTAIRQSIAVAFLLLAFDALSEKKEKRFLIYVAIASLFHLSAISFLLALLLRKLKISKKYILCIPFIFIISQVSGILILRWMVRFLPDQYAGYSERTVTLNLSSFIIISVIVFFCLLLSRGYENDENIGFGLILILVSLFAYGYANSMFAEMFRIGHYYSFYVVITVPNAFDTLILKYKRDRFFVTFSGWVCFLLYFFCAGGARFIEWFD